MILTDEQCIAIYDEVSRTNITRDVKTPEKKIAAVRRGLGKREVFQLGERVTKIKGSKWTGRVVGFYSTALTPYGYAVESETEIGSVQIYPAAALISLEDHHGPTDTRS